ncbi:hypothetical protein IMZ11_35410 [Microtetraspora sp. AC03309]|uniref:hypothetical protein n=1 Tax=Microtetraspora sp. AC03309 TaxID=2779376 RepID=UPI001E30011B|nr:hypothetical protein [Microtetraspora sp. AC03309]MCC5580916.1 hypothetical protein [Microtetraspora sp. AC03309]
MSVPIEHDWLTKPDPAALPDATENLVAEIPGVAHRDIAVPFDYASLGIAFSRKQFPGGLGSWADPLDPAVHGKVGLYSTPSPSVAAWVPCLKSQGKIDHAPAEMTIEEALEVVAFLNSERRPDDVQVEMDYAGAVARPISPDALSRRFPAIHLLGSS